MTADLDHLTTYLTANNILILVLIPVENLVVWVVINPAGGKLEIVEII